MKKILLISLNALGDTYITLSSINPLSNYFPGVYIDLLTIKESSLFTGYFGLNKVFYLNKSNMLSYMKSVSLLRNKYDYVFSFFPGRLNTFFTEFSRAKDKYYFRNYKKRDSWHDNVQELYQNGRKTGTKWHPEDNDMYRIEMI